MEERQNLQNLKAFKLIDEFFLILFYDMITD